MLRAVIYARYSSDNQRDASIEDQVRDCRTFIKRQDWTYLHAYNDRAISGASALRPGYQRLLADARDGRFDMVVAEALDRLSRDQETVAALYKRLSFAGIRIVTLSEGEITELHVGLKGTMNALFLKDLAQKTRRGLRGRVEAGKSGGGNAYGYDVVHELGPDGLPVRGKRRVNQAKAEVVRQIFAAYAAGRSARQVAHDLNARGIAAPGDRSWGASTISGNLARGTGILNNELYIGRLVWNKLRYIKDPETGRRVSRLNEPERWVVKELPEFRIVDQELWNRVKARQAAMRCDTRPDVRIRPCDRRRPRYLLSGLVVCGVCGARYTKISADLFGYAAVRNKGAAVCANLRNVRRDRLEATVLDGLRHHLVACATIWWTRSCSATSVPSSPARSIASAAIRRGAASSSPPSCVRSSAGCAVWSRPSRRGCRRARSRTSFWRSSSGRISSRPSWRLRPSQSRRGCTRTSPRSIAARSRRCTKRWQTKRAATKHSS
jgi:site-specific DNA recombinase